MDWYAKSHVFCKSSTTTSFFVHAMVCTHWMMFISIQKQKHRATSSTCIKWNPGRSSRRLSWCPSSSSPPSRPCRSLLFLWTKHCLSASQTLWFWSSPFEPSTQDPLAVWAPYLAMCNVLWSWICDMSCTRTLDTWNGVMSCKECNVSSNSTCHESFLFATLIVMAYVASRGTMLLMIMEAFALSCEQGHDTHPSLNEQARYTLQNVTNLWCETWHGMYRGTIWWYDANCDMAFILYMYRLLNQGPSTQGRSCIRRESPLEIARSSSWKHSAGSCCEHLRRPSATHNPQRPDDNIKCLSLKDLLNCCWQFNIFIDLLLNIQ